MNERLRGLQQYRLAVKLRYTFFRKAIFFNLAFIQHAYYTAFHFNEEYLITAPFLSKTRLIINWLILSLHIYYNFFTSKFHLFKNGVRFYEPYFPLIKFSIFHFKRFFDWQYNMQSYKSMANVNSSNNLKDRLGHLKKKPFIFLGFKIKCVGRFTRKQRASSKWFSLGRVPLTKTSAVIDYGAHTLPLANSAITIKVWIQKMFNEGMDYARIII